MSARDGDGWTMCECGGTHWGRFGAAGLLLVRTDQEVPRVLLQLRAAWTHGGGSWALPGGALDSHEDPVEAAVREAEEEAGIAAHAVAVRHVFTDDHGNWSYHTVIAATGGDAGAYDANMESDEVRWVEVADVDGYQLHPGLAATWPALRTIVDDLFV
jgi:8-oxo-dGTP diphosphatase